MYRIYVAPGLLSIYLRHCMLQLASGTWSCRCTSFHTHMHVWTCMCRSGEVGLYVTLWSFYLYGVGGRQRDMPFRSTTAAGWMQPEQEWKSAGVEFSSGRPCRAARLTQHTPRALIRSLYRHRCKVRPSVRLSLASTSYLGACTYIH